MINLISDAKPNLTIKDCTELAIFFSIPFIAEVIFSILVEPFYIIGALRTGLCLVILYLTYKGSRIAAIIICILLVITVYMIFKYAFILGIVVLVS